jgi:acetyl esterase/lipase
LAERTRLIALAIAALAFPASAPSAAAQTVELSVDRNVVYGMVAGASLLLDVHRPAQPNGLGVIVIAGSSFGTAYRRGYEDTPLRADYDEGYFGAIAHGLVAHGYTVFMIDHRFAPAFRYPQIVADVQRAVRFVRAHASEYDIDPLHLGALGHSSGAYLAAMVGVRDTTIADPQNSAVEQQSSRVQAVVAIAAPFVLTETDRAASTKMNADFLGAAAPRDASGKRTLAGIYATASPITRVTAETAPMLIYHAQDDSVVAKRNAEMMATRMQDAGATVRLVLRDEGGHAPRVDLGEIDAWFRRYLK